MADPTPQEHEQARAIALDLIDCDHADIIGACCDCMESVIATVLAEQRYRNAEAIEAAGDKHAGLIGKDVPQRMASIAALYLRSGYDADAIRREDV